MATPSPAQIWIGRALTGLSAFGLLASAGMKLSHSEEIVKNWETFGFPANTLTPIGVTELIITVLSLIPATRVLGLVLITGYLGGAIATHVHAGEGFAAPLILALIAWGGLYLREPRLHSLLPIRKDG